MKKPKSESFKSRQNPSFHKKETRVDVSHVVYGRNPVTELLRAKRRDVLELFATTEALRALGTDFDSLVRAAKIKIQIIDMQRCDKLSGGGVHQGVVARVAPYPYVAFEDVLEACGERALILMLDCVQDPQNFATLCRSALAFGVDAIVLPRDRSVAVTATVCKASSGAVEHLKICQVTNLVRAMEQAKESGFWIYGTSLAGDPVPLNQANPAAKAVLVLGSEGDGLRSLVAKTCDVLIKIPMKVAFDSLNVAQAGTVCLYEFAVR